MAEFECTNRIWPINLVRITMHFSVGRTLVHKYLLNYCCISIILQHTTSKSPTLFMTDIRYCYLCYFRSLLKRIKPKPVIFCKVVFRFGRVWGSSSFPLLQHPELQYKQTTRFPVSHSLSTPSPPLIHIIQ